MATPGYISTDGFELFPGFPVEVRLMIWEQACCTERIIPLLPGQGHLFPRVHPLLAVPAVLHACSESRRIALKHYNLSFHAQIYTNPRYDTLMLHLFFPFQLIDFDLYSRPEADFNWDAAPGRLAVLLDDIGVHQSDEDESNRAWRTDPAWHQRLLPFSRSFVRSLVGRGSKLEELTLLVLPPLTARPNSTAHRFDFVEGVPDLVDMSEYLTTQLRDRAHGEIRWPLTSPIVRVRHATCSLWPSSDANGHVPWSTTIRERHPAPAYADMEFGDKPVREAPQPGLQNFSFVSDPSPWGISSCRRTRILAIRRDLKALKEPFCADIGLGPYALWEGKRYFCATGMWGAGIAYEADRQLLWVRGHEHELPKLESPTLTDFDFDRFLGEDFESPFEFSPADWQLRVIEQKKREEEEVEEEQDPWNIKSLRFNGLYYWT
jgi:hypothetical protein